jgi:hypothetical protein
MTDRAAEIRDNLERMMGPVLHSDLQAHLARDAVFLVAPHLSLLDVGVGVAMDDVDAVKRWIDAGELRKPTQKERDAWPPGVWISIVVQPFVLVQLEMN